MKSVWRTCGIMVSFDLRSCSPIMVMSQPSILTQPCAGSIRRKRPSIREDLPAPVRPTTPSWRKAPRKYANWISECNICIIQLARFALPFPLLLQLDRFLSRPDLGQDDSEFHMTGTQWHPFAANPWVDGSLLWPRKPVFKVAVHQLQVLTSPF